MIKKIAKTVLNIFGYEVVKKYDSRHGQDAFQHNTLEHVNEKNKDIIHFKRNISNDSKFIDCIYPYIKQLLIKKDLNLLDVGCGSGILVNKLLKDKLADDINGCDFASSKIEQCNSYYNSSSYFVHDILTPLEKEYNIITCTEVLEHLEYPEKAFDNLVAALSVNGKLIITVPDGRKDSFAGHIHFWSPESFKLFVIKELDKHLISKEFSINYDLICGKNLVKIQRLK